MSNEARWQYPDLVIKGIGFRPALLANGERAFSNRGHLWQNVPTTLAGKLIARSHGNQTRDIHVTARRDTTLVVLTSSSDGPPGWTPLGVLCGYNAGGDTPMFAFSRAMSADESIAIPQLGFSARLPVIDVGQRPLALWRVAPDALPAVADSENAGGTSAAARNPRCPTTRPGRAARPISRSTDRPNRAATWAFPNKGHSATPRSWNSATAISLA